MRPLRLAAIAACAAVLVVAGCGGGGGGGGPTKAQFVARASAICRIAAARIDPLINRISSAGGSLVLGGAGAARRLAPVVDQLHTVAAADLAKLRGLAKPAGDAPAIERFLTPLAGVVDATGKAGSSLAAGQPIGALAVIQQAQPLVQQVTSAAQGYGLPVCGSLLASLG